MVIIIMYTGVLTACMSVNLVYIPVVQRGQKRESDALELELETAVS